MRLMLPPPRPRPAHCPAPRHWPAAVVPVSARVQPCVTDVIWRSLSRVVSLLADHSYVASDLCQSWLFCNCNVCARTGHAITCFTGSYFPSDKKSRVLPYLFPLFYFSLSFIGFTYFLLLSIPSLSTRIVPLRFQAGGRRRRLNVGFCFVCVIYIP